MPPLASPGFQRPPPNARLQRGQPSAVGLLAYYLLNTAGGLVVPDLSPWATPGKIVTGASQAGTPNWVQGSGNYGGGLLFRAATAATSQTLTGAATPTATFNGITLMAAIRLDSGQTQNSFPFIFGNRQVGNSGAFAISLNMTASSVVSFQSGGAFGATGPTIPADTDVICAMTLDNVSGNYALYLSGATTVTGAIGSGGTATFSGPFAVGYDPGFGTGRVFGGRIYWAAAWNRVLPAVEIGALMARPYRMIEPPLARKVYLFGSVVSGPAPLTAAGVLAADVFTLATSGTESWSGAGTLQPAAYVLVLAAQESWQGAGTLVEAAYTLNLSAVEVLSGAATLLAGPYTLAATAIDGANATATLLPNTYTLSAAAVEVFSGAATLLSAGYTLAALAAEDDQGAAVLVAAAYTLVLAAVDGQQSAAALLSDPYALATLASIGVTSLAALVPGAFLLAVAVNLAQGGVVALLPDGFALAAAATVDVPHDTGDGTLVAGPYTLSSVAAVVTSAGAALLPAPYLLVTVTRAQAPNRLSGYVVVTRDAWSRLAIRPD